MASAMRAARAQLEIATQNVANVSSDGFRRAVATVSLSERGLAVAATRSHEQGGVKQTGRPFDLALLGEGTFTVGGTPTRGGAFTRDRDGWIVDDRGRRLQGDRGPIRVSSRATITSDGRVHDGARVVARIPLPPGTTVLAGALESSSVNAIGETLAILSAQRAFETAQKTLAAIDATREKAVADVGRVQ